MKTRRFDKKRTKLARTITLARKQERKIKMTMHAGAAA